MQAELPTQINFQPPPSKFQQSITSTWERYLGELGEACGTPPGTVMHTQSSYYLMTSYHLSKASASSFVSFEVVENWKTPPSTGISGWSWHHTHEHGGGGGGDSHVVGISGWPHYHTHNLPLTIYHSPYLSILKDLGQSIPIYTYISPSLYQSTHLSLMIYPNLSITTHPI